MPSAPKVVEQKIDKMLTGWETLASEKSFGGMTFQQFKAVAKRSQDARQRIDELEEQRRQALSEREAADEEFNLRAQQVVNGVLADPTEGPDSALYESFGYTKKSDRKSGLTRKRNSTK